MPGWNRDRLCPDDWLVPVTTSKKIAAVQRNVATGWISLGGWYASARTRHQPGAQSAAEHEGSNQQAIAIPVKSNNSVVSSDTPPNLASDFHQPVFAGVALLRQVLIAYQISNKTKLIRKYYCNVKIT